MREARSRSVFPLLLGGEWGIRRGFGVSWEAFPGFLVVSEGGCGKVEALEGADEIFMGLSPGLLLPGV